MNKLVQTSFVETQRVLGKQPISLVLQNQHFIDILSLLILTKDRVEEM